MMTVAFGLLIAVGILVGILWIADTLAEDRRHYAQCERLAKRQLEQWRFEKRKKREPEREQRAYETGLLQFKQRYGLKP